MLIESGKVILCSSRLVITNLSFFKWSTWIQHLSICKRSQKSFFPDALCLRPPHSSGASIIITRSSFYRTASTSVDSGFSMSNLKSQSMLDKLHPWLPWDKCYRIEENMQAGSQATVRHRVLVVIVDSMQLNWNEITWHCWSNSQLAILATKADFPIPGNPLVQIISGPLTFLILVSMSCKIVVCMPSRHTLHKGSLFSPSMCNKLSNSFFSTCAMCISILRSQTCPWNYWVCPSIQLLSSFKSQQRYTWLEQTHKSQIYPDEDKWTCTFPAFKPSLNEVDHFFHYLGKLPHGVTQSIWFKLPWLCWAG